MSITVNLKLDAPGLGHQSRPMTPSCNVHVLEQLLKHSLGWCSAACASLSAEPWSWCHIWSCSWSDPRLDGSCHWAYRLPFRWKVQTRRNQSPQHAPLATSSSELCHVVDFA